MQKLLTFIVLVLFACCGNERSSLQHHAAAIGSMQLDFASSGIVPSYEADCNVVGEDGRAITRTVVNFPVINIIGAESFALSYIAKVGKETARIGEQSEYDYACEEWMNPAHSILQPPMNFLVY